MGRKRLLLGVMLLIGSNVIVAQSAAVATVHTAPCSQDQLRSGSCVSGSINSGGNGVDLGANKSGPASGGGIAPGGGKHKAPVVAPPVCNGLPEACQRFVVVPPGAPGNPSVTMRDLKDFPASPGTDHMQPNGWMVVGLDTNFYATIPSETVDGTLLGQPATVRFTPVSWHWTYGDGTAATRSTAGTTWAIQGIDEFDPTPTSHIYTAPGTYFIDLSITFTAVYRYANGGWTPVIGTITLPANRLEATAGDAKTVLVGRDCTQNPAGPGC